MCVGMLKKKQQSTKVQKNALFPLPFKEKGYILLYPQKECLKDTYYLWEWGRGKLLLFTLHVE